MYCTLFQFLRLPPSLQACVTHLDLSIASEEDFYRASRPKDPPIFLGLGVGSSFANDAEEYPGEAGFTYPQREKP